MPQSVELNWAMLKAGCLERKSQCAVAITRLRANAPDGLMNKGVRAIETVAAGLDAMISECEAKSATRRWEALVASRRADAAKTPATTPPPQTSTSMLRRMFALAASA